MSVKVNKDEFLGRLDQVKAGLSPKEIVEQSSCFAFADGDVFTFNEEVACRVKSGLPKEFRGAVKAEPLLNLLRKLKEDELDLDLKKEELVVTGKRRKAGIRTEAEVLLPVDAVEKPKGWVKVSPDFADAVQIVRECAGKDQTNFVFTCVHMTPKFMEACDNFQLTRYKIATGVEGDVLVRADALKHVADMGVTDVCVTPAWVHFKGDGNAVMSCRRIDEKFPDLTDILNTHGDKAVLPKALQEAVETAEIFSSENADHNHVKIELRADRLRIRGQGASGWYSEVKQIKYAGKPMAFMVGPKLIAELVRRTTDCEISKDHRLRVDGGKWVYVACLEKVEEEDKSDD